MRLDSRMFEQGLTQSREKARSLIMAGKVSVDGKPAQKPGMEVREDAEISIAEDPVPFVSRGGLKLEKALSVFELDVSGLVAADIGASTGGFTDCMLKHGAQKVYAIDVGYGQLDWKLRCDPRVVVMERTNARGMRPSWFDPAPAFASIDVSFISLRLILEPLYACLPDGAHVVALIKPQFEAGRAEVGKHGVVRDIGVHRDVCVRVIEQAMDLGFSFCGFSFSPVTGPKGNIEFLSLFRKAVPPVIPPGELRKLVYDTAALAHASLDR
ncbi:MAG TPA: TlyA family RNA methyltransferase [Feifaniaceae bacterium]|nr:TlyA family RNA methyltransferase [Feifaniaceae bacterium]